MISIRSYGSLAQWKWSKGALLVTLPNRASYVLVLDVGLPNEIIS
jgi:hypothetical protein